MNIIKNILKVLIILFIIVIVCIINPFKDILGETKAYLTIENKSGLTIEELSVGLHSYNDIYKKRIVKGLSPNGSFSVVFKDFGDSSYFIYVKLSNGVEIVNNVGYISSFGVYNDRIIINENGNLGLIQGVIE